MSSEPTLPSSMPQFCDIAPKLHGTSKSLLHALIEASPVAIVSLDAELRITIWNPAAERLFGWSESDVVGKFPPAEFIVDFGVFSEATSRAARGETLRRIRTERGAKDGSRKHVELWAAPIHGSNGAVIGMLAMFVDFTEREHQKRALAESIAARKQIGHELITSERQLRAVFDGTFDPMFLVDSESRYVDVNNAGCKLLALPKAEILGRTVGSLSVTSCDVAEQFRRAIRSGSAAGETSLVSNGVSRQIEFMVKANVLPGRHLLVVRDVTERTMLQKQFQQAQKMEAVGRLAGGVAHDFNNMLTVISGYGELLSKKLAADDPLRRYVSGIMHAADRSANITRQLLAFSRRQVMQPVELNINTVVDEMSGLLQRLIGEDIELKVSLAPQLGIVKADPAQISQILLNLVVNARDAMPGGGRLLIATENAEMDETYCKVHLTAKPGQYVQLTVNDSGCGIDSDLKAHIFEPFFTTKDQGKGTGLGLATVYGIVKQSGGYIWLYSEKGEGSTFKIYLPRVDAALEINDEIAGEALAGRGETVLVIEDDENGRTFVCEVLEEAGYKVLGAAGGNEALTLCQQHSGRVDLMLTDVVMPGTSGQDLSGYIRTRYRKAKIIYMSGFPKEELAARGIVELGEVLQKPFRGTDLLRRIRHVLESCPHETVCER